MPPRPSAVLSDERLYSAEERRGISGCFDQHFRDFAFERTLLMETHQTHGRQPMELPRVLGPVQAYCVVVGSVIGSGIFLVPASVAGNVPYMGVIVLVWIIGGLFS